MINTIKSYYKGEFKEALWLLGISIANFTLGIIAIAKWGNVGAGILLILGGFAIYQIIRAFWVLLVEQNRVERKAFKFDKDQASFTNNEIKKLEKKSLKSKKNTNYLLISFLFGLLCLFMGAFGNWSELSLGIGAALSLQCAIMLILGLSADYRSSFYLQKLKKFTSK